MAANLKRTKNRNEAIGQERGKIKLTKGTDVKIDLFQNVYLFFFNLSNVLLFWDNFSLLVTSEGRKFGSEHCGSTHTCINPLNTELNPICHLLALLGAHHILRVSGLRVNYNVQ